MIRKIQANHADFLGNTPLMITAHNGDIKAINNQSKVHCFLRCAQIIKKQSSY